MSEKRDPIAKALYETLISPNVSDSNLEPANLVDVGNNLARAVWWLGHIDQQSKEGPIELHASTLLLGARIIAAAIDNVAQAIRDHGRGAHDL